MPYCENCNSYENAVLEIKLPQILKKKNYFRDFRKREKAFLCFECIRTKARSVLDPNGYWFQFVFPHTITHRRYKH